MTRGRAAVLLGDAALLPRLLDDAALARLRSAVDLRPGVLTPATVRGALDDVDVLLTGWGAPPLDAALLDTAPGCGSSCTPPAPSSGSSPPRCGSAGCA
ncbi:hypothetical protein [Cellulomonas sp. JZ18]|uniref:hypothetical protein n=1 Tax=Cellulomonas sp. JZ18 TaxID=2654191 RepID=UPI001E3BF8CD|nr:hypothetical protein [Cellulomonas sp. JZ18]